DIRAPGHDVDFLALQFANHGLNARTAHTDAGADRVDGIVARIHRDLGAGTRVAGDCLDFDDTVIDFRHFLLEQGGHETGVGAGQENLRTAQFLAHIIDVAAHAIVRLEVFARDAFVAAQDGFAFAHVDGDV